MNGYQFFFFSSSIDTTEKDMTPQPLLNIEKCVNNTCGIINVNATHQKDVVINLIYTYIFI